MKSKKKYIPIAITLGLVTSNFSPVYAVKNIPSKILKKAKTAEYNKYEKIAIKTIPIERFKNLLDTIPRENKNWKIYDMKNKNDFFILLDKVYTELPQSVSIYNDVSSEELQQWKDKYFQKSRISSMKNIATLANYDIRKKASNLILLEDVSHDKYQAVQIEKSLGVFAKEFASSIRYLPPEQKVHVIYDYIYYQFKYKATKTTDMLVGNTYNRQLACNGFSRLFYELVKASNLPVRLVESEDHYYNHVKIEDITVNKTNQGKNTEKWLIIDLTTDILLNEKHGATGLSEAAYLSYVSKVGFYRSLPSSKELAVSQDWTNAEKKNFSHTYNSLSLNSKDIR
ncbi:hypothetical protein [Metabacillus fastidiosus]|uniref:hypothetical protein n=1 Tax=Metabacillus fastidiosus TaxID=1458 RepID=UPI003D2C4F0C